MSGSRSGGDDGSFDEHDVVTDFDPLVHERTRAGAGLGGPIYLLVREGESARVLELADGSSVTIGRAPSSTLVVDDSRVSRHHARIARSGDAVTLEDLGSRNGTLLNERVVRGETRAVFRGDTLRVASLELVLAATARHEREPSAPPGDEIVVADPAMVELFELARRVAQTTTTVLVLGETGAGKEVVAEHIHRMSPRAAGPFVALNCASIPVELIESELFGFEKGAFTGADKKKVGYVESAHGGTLLLDEIGELDPKLQAKLLRALETHKVVRLGSTRELPVDVRVICATHRDLKADVDAGRFRADLFYRISAFTLRVPPLRQRPKEVLLLAELFAGRAGRALAPETRAALGAHAWPGNVRELKNAIEHAAIVADHGLILPRHLPESVRQAASESSGRLEERMEDLERRSIEAALARHGGNQTHAAADLGISRRTLIYKLEKYGLKRKS